MMTIRGFCETYDLSIDTLYVGKASGSIPAHVFKHDGIRGTMIDEKFFLNRKQFRRKVWLESHTMFYFLNKHLSETDISRLMMKMDGGGSVGNWNTYVSDRLFRTPNESILQYKLSSAVWKFYRYCRWIIQHMFKVVGVPREQRDLERIVYA